MNNDRKTIYILSVSALALLLLALFIPFNSKLVASLLLLPFAFITYLLIKKRSVLSIHKGQVTFVIFIFGLIFLMLYYIFGIKFGFIKNPYFFNSVSIFQYIIPYFVIIVSIEIIRYVFLCQNRKFISILTFISAIIAEILMFNNLLMITSFNRFMDLVGLYLFPSITGNILYHKVSKQYGFIPNILFRLMSVITPYFIYVSPSTPDSLLALFKLLYPLGILAFISAFYDKKVKYATKRTNKLTYVSYGIFGVAMISIVMLISCQFRFGLIVIASDSMIGEFTRGDAVIYEQYKEQLITEGDIIVFEKDDSKIIHRVVKISCINNQMRYYTKGDANENIDVGFILDNNILGIVDFKISYIGYPTLWIRDVF